MTAVRQLVRRIWLEAFSQNPSHHLTQELDAAHWSSRLLASELG